MVLDSLSFDDAPDVDAPPANAPFADSDCYQKDNGTWSGGHTLARILAVSTCGYEEGLHAQCCAEPAGVVANHVC